jgi:copper chaperone CopZ
MKAYKTDKNKMKIEAENCVINVTEGLTDRYGRSVTSITVSPDNYAGEPKCIRFGYFNTRVVQLKKKR